MNMYVGVTDYDWYSMLKEQSCDEVNFWTPGGRSFRAISENELFLFKLHAPRNYIVGGGFFVKFSQLPPYLAWDAFGIKNGVTSLDQLEERINKYRSRNRMDSSNPQIGCIILTEPFFFDEIDWIPVPEDWSNSIVQGKRYSTDTIAGKKLFDEVRYRLSSTDYVAEGARYTISETKHRLGQGAFRIAVADAYQRRCAITGEKTLPVLEAAHIKPYGKGGEHSIPNGILLKSDFHTLFDKGYITIDTDYRINVSDKLHSDYGNGKDYYKHNGERLLIMPNDINFHPSKASLQWHNENVYLG
jgi:putative restriction endonuclease